MWRHRLDRSDSG